MCQLKLPSFTVKKYAVIYTLFQLLLEIYPQKKLFPDSSITHSAQALHKTKAEMQKYNGVDIRNSQDRSRTSIKATTLSSHRATDLQSS